MRTRRYGCSGTWRTRPFAGRAHWALGEAFAAMGAEASARGEFTRAGELIPPGSEQSARLLEAWQRLAPTEP